MARKTESRPAGQGGGTRAGGGTRSKASSSKASSSKATSTKDASSPATEAARSTGASADRAAHETARRREGDHAPPSDPAPNPAMLKADIESGRTGDKNPVADPGMSMLGTDDEVAGRPAEPERVRTAREAETGRGVSSADQSPRTDAGHTGRRGIVIAFAIGIVVFAAIFALVLLGA